MSIVQRLNEEQGITVIFVTHEPDIAEYPRRVIRLADGAIVEDRPISAQRRAGPSALDDGGQCQIYSMRPLICRSFGVALRHRSVEPLVHPAKIDTCDKNFQGTSLKTLPPEDVFDQARLNQRLDRLDAEYRQPHHLPDGERVPLAQIIADAMTLDE